MGLMEDRARAAVYSAKVMLAELEAQQMPDHLLPTLLSSLLVAEAIRWASIDLCYAIRGEMP